ncbi:hypothetical protein ABW19_dt0203333 [Dactylella cylindrospora]|nr:hypothetical protein ABW19_dt0203333 [Dactylella cylindrospora]
MDDLAGLNWTSSSSNNTTSKHSAAAFSATPASSSGNYLSFRSSPALTPQSTNGTSRPSSTKPPFSGSNLRDETSKASGSNGMDSFSSLVNFNAKKAGNPGNLSLLEQQKKMQEDRLKVDQQNKQRLNQQFSGLDSLGSFGGPGSLSGRSGTSTPARNDPEEADLLAGFSADTKVNRASHFPPPSATPPINTSSPLPLSSRPTPSPKPQATVSISQPSDDPFDLASFDRAIPSYKPSSSERQSAITNDDDDVLGLLGKPISDFKRESPSPPPKPARPARHAGNVEGLPSRARTPPSGKDPRDPAIAELADMGFSVEDAKRALAQTDTGLDVRGAIDFLLNEAHGKTKSRGQGHNHARKVAGEGDFRDEYARPSKQGTREKTGKPAWQGQGDVQDVAAYAQEIGGNLLKTAGSLWATGRKKVAQAINDLQEDGTANDGTPKWMREAQREQQGHRNSKRQDGQATDEAMMLETGANPRKARQQPQPRERTPMSKEEQEFAEEQRLRQMQREERERRQEAESRAAAAAVNSRRSKLTREAIESEQVYISPARRRGAKPTSTPAAPQPLPKSEVAEGNLLFGDSSSKPLPPRPQAVTPSTNNPFSQPSPKKQPAPTPPAKPRSARQIPALAASTLSSSTTSRTAGTEAFKRGDYPSALTLYTTSLQPIPPTHPIHFLILTNRAIVHIKLGDSKAALEDCDTVISGIGGSKGVGEVFDLGDGTSKELKEIWGKAAVRRAEALEHLERWSDAGAAWSLALENGVGGASASAGKARCEKALAPKPAPRPQSTSAKKQIPAKAPPRRPATSAQSAEAVTRLRAANAAAERADEEKLALHDSVEAKLVAWKGGKETNLRALIASLDTVLWDGSGWKKVGMHELVMPNKVKIAYMKGIAKVHPDKISQDATTEQKMLAAAVFATLNEAWDEFKKQNNL